MEDYLIGIIISGVVAFVFLVVIITILSMHCYRKYTLEKIYVKRKYVSDHTPNGTLPTVSHYLESGARPHPYAVNGYPYTTVPQRHLAAYRPKVLNTEDIYPNENHKEREKKAKTFNGPYSSRPNGDIGHDLSKYKVRRAHRQPDWTLKAYEESGITIDLEEEVTPRDSSFKSNHSTEKVTVGENNNSRVVEPDNADFTIVDYVATDRSPQTSPAPPIKPPSDNNTEAFDHHPYQVRLRPVDNPDESKPKVVDHTRQRKAHEGGQYDEKETKSTSYDPKYEILKYKACKNIIVSVKPTDTQTE